MSTGDSQQAPWSNAEKPGGFKISLLVIAAFLLSIIAPLLIGVPVQSVLLVWPLVGLTLGFVGLYVLLQRKTRGLYLLMQVLVVLLFVQAGISDVVFRFEPGVTAGLVATGCSFVAAVVLAVRDCPLFRRPGTSFLTLAGSLIAYFILIIPGTLLTDGLVSGAAEAVRRSRGLLLGFVVSGILLITAFMYLHLFLAALFSLLGLCLKWLTSRERVKGLRRAE